jgi:hypothetical protein
MARILQEGEFEVAGRLGWILQGVKKSLDYIRVNGNKGREAAIFFPIFDFSRPMQDVLIVRGRLFT